MNNNVADHYYVANEIENDLCEKCGGHFHFHPSEEIWEKKVVKEKPQVTQLRIDVLYTNREEFLEFTRQIEENFSQCFMLEVLGTDTEDMSEHYQEAIKEKTINPQKY